jgi:DNA-binding GntR family transcriptional regulator
MHFEITQSSAASNRRSPSWYHYEDAVPALGAEKLEEGLHEPCLDGHRAIVEAIRGKQAEEVAYLMQIDIERTQSLLQQFRG